MPVSPVATLTLLVLLAAAAVADARTRRIPNRLTLAGILLGLLLAITGGGPAAFASALAGSGAAFAAFFVLYALGGMGAGDVKLVAAAGAFLGVPLVGWGLLLSALAGGVLAVGALIANGALRRWPVAAAVLATGGGARSVVQAVGGGGAPLKVPYGVAIAVGCGFAAALPGLSPL